jgi:hypothetical protein
MWYTTVLSGKSCPSHSQPYLVAASFINNIQTVRINGDVQTFKVKTFQSKQAAAAIAEVV